MNNAPLSPQGPNATKLYITLAIGILIGFVGIMLRFTWDSSVISWIANILLVAGTFICLKVVIGGILK